MSEGLQPGMKLPKSYDRKHKWPELSQQQQKLVQDNLWVATKISYKMFKYGNTGSYTQEDLEGVGFFALCVAATRYDNTRETKFSTYSWPFVKGWMQHAIRDYSRMVRLPRVVLKMRAKVKTMIQEGHSYQEISDELDLTVAEIALCETSWREEFQAIDLIQEDRKPLQLEHKAPTYKSDFDPDCRAVIESLDDKEMRMLTNLINGVKMSKSRTFRANELYHSIKNKIHLIDNANQKVKKLTATTNITSE